MFRNKHGLSNFWEKFQWNKNNELERLRDLQIFVPGSQPETSQIQSTGRFQTNGMLSPVSSFENQEQFVRKEGWLLKRGSLFNRDRTMWFEVDESVCVLTYYTAPPSMGPIKSKIAGTINLEGARIDLYFQRESSSKSDGSASASDPSSPPTNPTASPKSPKEQFDKTFSDKNSEKDMRKITIRKKKGLTKVVVLMCESYEEASEWGHALKKCRDFGQSSLKLIEEWKQQDGGAGDFARLAAGMEDDDEDGSGVLNPPPEEKEGRPTRGASQSYLNDLFSIKVEDAQKDGAVVPLGEILGTTNPTILMLMRHFGCILCRQAALHFASKKEEFEKLGISVVAIGQGTPLMAKSFAKEFNFPGKIYLDSGRAVYKALSCRRGVKLSLNKKTYNAGKKAMSNGLKQGDTTGDIFQLGGVFVLSQSMPNPFLYSHIDAYAGDYVDLDKTLTIVRTFIRNNPYLHWPSLSREAFPPVEWNTLTSQDFVIESSLVKETKGVKLELGRNNVPNTTTRWMLEEADMYDLRLYAERMAQVAHLNFTDDGKIEDNPVAISMDPLDHNDVRVIVRTKKGIHRLVLPYDVVDKKEKAINYIKAKVPAIADVKLVQADNTTQLIDLLASFEEKMLVQKYKFGIVNALPGMDVSNENDLYSSIPVSSDFEQFMTCLGDVIFLKGWDKFSGGLDKKENLTGEKALYTELDGIEILFHVCPFMPFSEHDPQQIARKKYIGNDVVVIVFTETDDPIDVNVFASQFNHIFCIVKKSKMSTPTQTMYEVAFAIKGGVHPFGMH
eukprot:TRINITY_DN8597_c0_g1_i1.p1 TRINITY_DN8597_c0_g1~~TRINITY_DN8597_c0_g1_i1.p1  ORF type:complete len:784 (-),score=205.48 TRINITY_DN8597_c0_g1_i1:411-2762(-)